VPFSCNLSNPGADFLVIIRFNIVDAPRCVHGFSATDGAAQAPSNSAMTTPPMFRFRNLIIPSLAFIIGVRLLFLFFDLIDLAPTPVSIPARLALLGIFARCGRDFGINVHNPSDLIWPN